MPVWKTPSAVLRPVVPPDIGLSSKPVRLPVDGECQGEFPMGISSLYAYAPRRSPMVASPTPATFTPPCAWESAGRQAQRPIPAARSPRRAHLPALAVPTLFHFLPSLHGQTGPRRADVSKCRRARKCLARQSGRVFRSQDLPKRGVLRQKTAKGFSLPTDKEISEPCYRSPAAGRR